MGPVRRRRGQFPLPGQCSGFLHLQPTQFTQRVVDSASKHVTTDRLSMTEKINSDLFFRGRHGLGRLVVT
jgi:hypothetical protein